MTEQHVQRLARSSRRAALASAIGVLIVIGSIGYSAYTLHRLTRRVETKQQELAEITQEKEHEEKRVRELEDILRQTMDFDKHRYELDWGLSKTLASNAYTAALVDDIFAMRYQDVRWELGGTSPEKGFDSPSFAAYLLIVKNEILDIDFKERYRLRELLPGTDSPRPVDLIFYDIGYTMFYFRDRSGVPFCIGMTPLGIVALEINFGPRLLGYGRVEY